MDIRNTISANPRFSGVFASITRAGWERTPEWWHAEPRRARRNNPSNPLRPPRLRVRQIRLPCRLGGSSAIFRIGVYQRVLPYRRTVPPALVAAEPLWEICGRFPVRERKPWRLSLREGSTAAAWRTTGLETRATWNRSPHGLRYDGTAEQCSSAVPLSGALARKRRDRGRAQRVEESPAGAPALCCLVVQRALARALADSVVAGDGADRRVRAVSEPRIRSVL